jgi:hypothetical protein
MAFGLALEKEGMCDSTLERIEVVLVQGAGGVSYV